MTSKEALKRIATVLGLTNENFFESKTEQGMAVKMEGELEVGAPIYVATEEGMIPAPPGKHMLEDGTEIEVDDDGKVSKIKVGEMEVEVETEDEMEKSMEQMSVEEQFGDIKLKDGTVLRLEGEEPSVGLQIRKVGYDGSLSAVHDGLYETSDGKVISIVGGAIDGVQSAADNKKRGEGFAEYPWDECMADQMERYKDEETAKKVCGAIKAGNMAAEFTIAKTAEGAVVESKTFDVGEDVFVLGEDGKKEKAPDGEHQVVLKDSSGNENKIRFITKDGKITQRENVEEMEQMMEIAKMFSEALKKIDVKIDELGAKQKKLEEKFQKFSMEPAGSRVFTQKTINEESKSISSKYEGFKKLREALIQNKI